MRAIAVDARPDGVLEVRNTGTLAWPAGRFIADRVVYDLPALAAGAATRLRTEAGKTSLDGAVQTALSRIPADGQAALWKLDLGTVAYAPVDSVAWLLVSMSPP